MGTNCKMEHSEGQEGGKHKLGRGEYIREGLAERR